MAKSGPTPKRILATRTDHLPVQLTEPEIREAGKRLAHLEGQLAEHTAKAQEVKDQLKHERSKIEGQVHGIASMIRAGVEYRPTPVRVEADYKAGRVYEIREDTGEVIGDRPVNETDRQAPLFDVQPMDDLRREAAKSIDRMNEAAESLNKASRERQAKKGTSEKFPSGSGLDEPCTECGASKGAHAGQRCPPRPGQASAIRWTTEPDGRVLGVAADGLVYAIQPDNGRYRWTQGKKRSGTFDSSAAAKADAETVELERVGDGILANAGDAALNAKALKGKAEAWKGGRR